MSKSRDTIAKATFEVVATQLVHALEEGTKVWPLPSPPTVSYTHLTLPTKRIV